MASTPRGSSARTPRWMSAAWLQTSRSRHSPSAGWGSPDTSYYRAHLKEMETIPFDGLVLSVMKLKGNDPPDNMGWCAFGSDARFTPQDCQHAIDDLKAAKSKQFRHNFIQVVTSGNVDWFDPKWPQIATNVALLARVAKQGDCKGIMLDAEQYDRFRMWTYATLPENLKAAHGFDEYRAKVRERGRELIRACLDRLEAAVDYVHVRTLLVIANGLRLLGESHPDFEPA